MTKKQLRREYIKKRSSLSRKRTQLDSLKISQQLKDLPIWSGQNYHLFLPIPTKAEVDTEYILQLLHGKDKNAIIPKSDFSTKTMQHYLLTDSQRIKPNAQNIPEPVGKGITIPSEDIDVVFVPLLAYDHHGNRIGYGGGFYDRFLSECRTDCYKIGLSFFPPAQKKLPTGDHDIPLDAVVTPDKIWQFGLDTKKL